ncbi:hypothetical protein LCGC14_0318120 [marine sediment metagenome]|uniref:Uncharacterized protein n=1 Tax=marine sediment metagenome TaxID=412755 RepID=A0A0F9WS00_9ZZZZ
MTGFFGRISSDTIALAKKAREVVNEHLKRNSGNPCYPRRVNLRSMRIACEIFEDLEQRGAKRATQGEKNDADTLLDAMLEI